MLGATYSRSANTVALTATGSGRFRNQQDKFSFTHLSAALRLLPDRYRMSSNRSSTSPSNALADLSATRRFSKHVDAVLQVQNLMDYYTSDNWIGYASMGRQVRTGLTIRP
jgi:outer membrane receptor protein involved in Fe transport